MEAQDEADIKVNEKFDPKRAGFTEDEPPSKTMKGVVEIKQPAAAVEEKKVETKEEIKEAK